MGLRGPAPEPTEILKKKGCWKAARREKDGEPTLPIKVPTLPAWLSKEAKAEWRRQARHLKAMRVVTEADRAALACWCEVWAEFVALACAIQEKVKPVSEGGLGALGYTCAIAEGLVSAKAAATKHLLALAAQFGFTPSARTRLRAQPEEKGDPMESFLNGEPCQN